MPRFYFPIADAQGWIPDEEGIELPDNQAAGEARATARDLAATMLREGKKVDGRRVLVVSDGGRLVCEVPVKLALSDTRH